LQLGIGAMSLANGYAREPGSEAQSGSPWRRRWALLVLSERRRGVSRTGPGKLLAIGNLAWWRRRDPCPGPDPLALVRYCQEMKAPM
jgi:hypothetical protein